MPPTDPYELLKQLRAQYGLAPPPPFQGAPGSPAHEVPGDPVTTTTTESGDPGTADRTIPGYTPDYNRIVAGDPLLAQSLSQLSAQGISDEATRRAGVQRGIIQFGAAPAELGNYLGDVDAQTRALAETNTGAGLSISARIQKAHNEAVNNLRYALASRGMLQSGSLGVGLTDEEQRYKTANYDAVNQLLSYLSGVSSAFADSKRQQAIQQGQARSDAYSRAYGANPPIAPTIIPGTPATPPHTTTTTEPGPTVTAPAVPASPAYDPYAALAAQRLAIGRTQRADIYG